MKQYRFDVGGTHFRVPTNATVTPVAPDDERKIRVSLLLNHRGSQEERDVAVASVLAGDRPGLSREECIALWDGPEVALTAVAKHVESAGLTVLPREKRHEMHGVVPVEGTAAQIKKAFGALFHSITHEGRTWLQVIDQPHIRTNEADLQKYIKGIDGLNQRPVVTKPRHKVSPRAAFAFDAREMMEKEGIPFAQLTNLTGVYLAFISLGGNVGLIPQALAAMFQKHRSTPPTWFQNFIDGAVDGDPNDDSTGEDFLDAEAEAAAIAGADNALLGTVALNTNDSYAGGGEACNAWEHPVTKKPLTAYSSSWGNRSKRFGNLDRWVTIEEVSKARGIRFTGGSSGDDGETDSRLGETDLDQDCPALVIRSMGGTEQVYSDDGSQLVGVKIWNDESIGRGAEGAGVSNTIDPTPLQVDFGNVTGFKPVSFDLKKAGRWVPLVVGPGSPVTGQNTWLPDGHGGLTIVTIAGTSLASPYTVAKLALFFFTHGITDGEKFLFECAKRKKGFLRPTVSLGPYQTDPNGFADVPGGLGYPIWDQMHEVAVELGFSFNVK